MAKVANWQPKVAASNLSNANVVTGRGIAFGCYSNTLTCGVADIEVNKKTGKIVANALHVARDAGLTSTRRASRTRGRRCDQGHRVRSYEQVDFDTKRVTSLDWVTYPILRFKDAPKIHVHGLTPHRRARPGRPELAHDGLGRAAAVAGARGDRQRVLRRDRRADPRGADDAGPRPGCAQGCRKVS